MFWITIIACLFVGHTNAFKITKPMHMRKTALRDSQFRFLESNTWELNINKVNIFLDPVMSQLDFGIPLFYTGNKKSINGEEELDNVASRTDLVLISQGLDDHCHTPTIKKLAIKYPNLPYICPPSAKPVLLSCGVSEKFISTISPNEKIIFKSKNNNIEIKATTGALVGPPWQNNENGYLIKSANSFQINNKNNKYTIYYEPHCMFDENELSQYTVDCVISPIVSQELPFYTLVAGGQKVLKLCKILKSKYLIPMANGELIQSGLLSKIIQTKSSINEIKDIVNINNDKLEIISVIPGEKFGLNV